MLSHVIRLYSMSKIFDFFKEVKVELSKVVWPTSQDTIKLTIIVIIVTISVGFFIGSIDFILVKLFRLFLNR